MLQRNLLGKGRKASIGFDLDLRAQHYRMQEWKLTSRLREAMQLTRVDPALGSLTRCVCVAGGRGETGPGGMEEGI